MNKYYLRFLKLRVLWRRLKRNPYFIDLLILYICLHSSDIGEDPNWIQKFCQKWCLVQIPLLGMFCGIEAFSTYKDILKFLKKKHSILIIITCILMLPIIGWNCIFACIWGFCSLGLIIYAAIKMLTK